MNRKEVTWKDLCKSAMASRLGIDNTPDDISQVNLEALVRYIVNPIFDRFPSACITSGYRCEALNKKVGGVKKSQHTKGQAVDLSIVIPGKTIKESIIELYRYIGNNLPFDQMIIYPTFVHVSYNIINGRREIINKAQKIYDAMPERYRLR